MIRERPMTTLRQERALKHMEKTRKPAILDITVERETDCSTGASIDAIQEFEKEREARERQG
jgi:glyoxylate carboligase